MIRDYLATAFAIDRFFRTLRGTLLLRKLGISERRFLEMFGSLTYLNFLLLRRKFSEPATR